MLMEAHQLDLDLVAAELSIPRQALLPELAEQDQADSFLFMNTADNK